MVLVASRANSAAAGRKFECFILLHICSYFCLVFYDEKKMIEKITCLVPQFAGALHVCT